MKAHRHHAAGHASPFARRSWQLVRPARRAPRSIALALALLLPQLDAEATDLRMKEERTHVDFAKGAEGPSEGLPQVTKIVRTWVEESSGDLLPGSPKPAPKRVQELLLIDAGDVSFHYQQEQQFAQGTAFAELKILWGPDSSETLSATYEWIKAADYDALREKVAEKPLETPWIEAVLGARVFYYPEEAWATGAIHADDRALLVAAIGGQTRDALERLDRLTREGYVPYYPFLTGMLVFPVLRPGPGEKLVVADYVNEATLAKEMSYFSGAPPDCAFDASFGEECSAEMRAREEAAKRRTSAQPSP